MTMDVSLRLRLQNQLSREAKVAERDLKGLGDEAKKLGRSAGTDNLSRGIKEIGREADRGEKLVRDLDRQARKLNTIDTSAASKELRALGQSAKTTNIDLDATRRKLSDIGRIDGGKLEKLHAPAARLDATLGLLSASAAGAMTGLLAYASADNIIRGLEQMSEKFRQLNRDVMDVAITLEMATPEAVSKITASNERLGIRYGRSMTEVNDARKRYAASGIGLDSQEAILDPTLKAAMTYKTSGEVVADAMIAAKQNLGVKDTEVPQALDMMAKGAKLGNFEVGAMAKSFPSLGAYMAGAGRTGLAGWGELIAMSQLARTTSGSEDEAATNLRNWLSKLSSRDTVENFKKKGVSLEKVKATAEKDGKSYPIAVLDQVQKLTGGNEFEINELFADQQAYQALKPLLDNRALFEDFLSQIMNDSAGGVDKDAPAAASTPYEKERRRNAALEATGSKIGEAYDRQMSPLADRAVRLINPEYDRQRTIEEQPELLKETSLKRLDLENEILRLQGLKRDMGDGGGGSALGPQINRLKEQLQTLIEEEAAIVQNAREAQAQEPVPVAPDNGDLGVSTGKIPIPIPRPAEQKLGADLSGAAEKAMQGYNDRLATEGDRAVSIAAEKAAEMQRVLNFTAQPTIQPNFLPPAAGPASPPSAAAGKQSSLSPTSNRINQTIVSPNPKHAALRANRMQERAIRQAQARSLRDTGRGLA